MLTWSVQVLAQAARKAIREDLQECWCSLRARGCVDVCCSSRSQSFNEWRAPPLIKDFTITSVWFITVWREKINMLIIFSFYFTACLFRYNWLSFVYLIYLLLIPLFAEPTKTTMRGECDALHSSADRYSRVKTCIALYEPIVSVWMQRHGRQQLEPQKQDSQTLFEDIIVFSCFIWRGYCFT